MAAPPLDWNDVRIFLAVDRGSTLAAARDLGVSQSTVSRRIEAMEAAMGLELFNKRRSGYVLAEAGREVLDAARSAAAAMQALESAGAGIRRELSGTVRLTTNDAFANHLLDRAVAQFRMAYPAIQVEIVASTRRMDLAKGEADVALRAGPRPTETDLVGRRIAEETWSVYCSRAYAAAHGIPRSPSELKEHRFIGVPADHPATPLVGWVEEHVPASAVFVRRDSIEGLYSSIVNSTGVSLMSDFLAGADENLVRCFSPGFGPLAEIWLLTHERLRHVPRIRALVDFLYGYLTSGERGMAAAGKEPASENG